MAETLALVWDLIANDHASGTFRRVGTEAEGASAGVGKLVGGLSLLAAGGAIAASVKAASDFQASMLLVQTQAGATADEVRKMSPAILSLAGQVAQAPEALATSLYHVESTGLRGSKALEAVKIAAEGARVGHADLEETTNALTATIASGMLPATETYAQAMGQLNTIVGSGDMKMSDLNEALGTGLLVTVKQFGVTVPDVGAALADFGDNNIRGADAATKLRMAVQAIESPGKNAAYELGRIGLTSKQLADDMATGGLNKALTDLHTHLVNSGIDASQWGQLLTDAFTKKAGSGVLTLIGTFDRFQQKYKEVSDGAGSFGNAWAATTKTASTQFAALKDTVDAVGIRIGTALLPPLGDLAHWFTTTGIPAVEHFWASVQKFTQSQGFQSFLKDVETLGAGAWRAIQQVSGVLIDLGSAILPPLVAVGGQLLHVFTELPGPVQAMAAAFVALRIAAAKGMFDGLMSGLGSVRGAFTGFSADINQGAVALGRVGMPLPGLTSALVTTAERGMGVLKSAGQGVVNMLGGPFGTSVALAGIAVGGFAASLQNIDRAAQSVTDSLKSGSPMGSAFTDLQRNQSRSITDAHSVSDAWHILGAAFSDGAAQLQGYSSAASKAQQQGSQAYQDWYSKLSSVAKAQQDVNLAQKAYDDAASTYGANSSQARSAAGLLRQATDGVANAQERENRAQQTHMTLLQQQASADSDAVTTRLQAEQAQSLLNTALDQYNSDAHDGQHNTKQLADESNNLALQMIGAAKQAGEQASAQAKANGVTDDGTLSTQAQLDMLGKVAGQLTGPGHDAIVQYMTDLGKAHVAHGDLNDAIGKLGLNVVGTWDNNTKIIQGATAQEIQDLKNLGLNVLSLPGMPGHPAQILVTANTDPAYNTLDAFTKKAAQLGFVGAIYNIAPLGAPGSGAGSKTPGFLQPLVPHKAVGGSIVGPGTGTSDSVLIAASNGEHMWTAAEVAAAGGHGAVESLRKAVLAHGGGRAEGGAIYPVDWSQSTQSGWASSLSKAQAALAAAPGGSVERLRPIVNQVLQMLGISMSAANGVLSMIQHESGGQSAIVNRSDSNWRAGHPSVGDMQVIAGTFAQYAGPFRNTGPFLYGVSTNDMANIYAGTNYALHNYGFGMLAAGGRKNAYGGYMGYDKGTNYVPETGLALLHKGEAVVPASKNQGAPYKDGHTTVVGVQNLGPVTYSDTERVAATSFRHAAMAAARFQ